MKRKIVKRLFAVCLAASLTVGLAPSVGISALAAGELAEAVKTGLTIRESEIHQLLTEDLELPTSVSGLEGATVTYSVGDADASYASVSGNTLKVTRPYAGEDDYKFKLTATVTADGQTVTKDFPMTIRAGLSEDSYAGYVYVCFADKNVSKTSRDFRDVQQVHFFLSEDGLNWTALNGCEPIFLTGSDYINDIESCGTDSLNYKVASGVDPADTVEGDASVLFPFEGDDQGIRDPYLVRGCKADGSDSNKVWILATDLNTMSTKYAGNKENNVVGNWGTMSSAGSTHLYIYETEDWVHWTRRWVDVGSEVGAAMAWAPEAIYNPEKDNYLVYWSARVETDGRARNRLYCNETSDFVNFGPTKLYEEEPFYQKYVDNGGASDNDGYGNIDTSQLWVADKDADGNVTNPYGTLYRVVKDETRTDNKLGTLLKIQLMKADSVLDPSVDYDSTDPTRITPHMYNGASYGSVADLNNLKNDTNAMGKAEIVYNWFRNESTGNHFEKIDQTALDDWVGWHEGATMFKFIDRDEWCIMVDNYGDMSVRYEPFTTTDLSKTDSVVKLKSGYGRTGGDVGCHGGMIPITVKEYNTLIETYNDQSNMVGLNEKALANYHEIEPIAVDNRKLGPKVAEMEKLLGDARYSEGVRNQMDVLGKKARAIEASGTATNADIERLMARIDKLIANQMIVVSQMDPEEVLLSDYLIVNLKKGKSKTISAQVSPFCAVQTVKWSSSNTKVATVDAKGKVTAKGKGTAVITATSTKKSSVKKTCKIVVN